MDIISSPPGGFDHPLFHANEPLLAPVEDGRDSYSAVQLAADIKVMFDAMGVRTNPDASLHVVALACVDVLRGYGVRPVDEPRARRGTRPPGRYDSSARWAVGELVDAAVAHVRSKVGPVPLDTHAALEVLTGWEHFGRLGRPERIATLAKLREEPRPADGGTS